MYVKGCFIVVVVVNLVATRGEQGASGGTDGTTTGTAVVTTTTKKAETCQMWSGGWNLEAWDPAKNWGNFIQQTNKFIEHTQEVTEQIVQKVNENSVSKYAGLGGQLLNQLTSAKDNHEKVNAFSGTITEAIKLNIQKSTDIPPLDLSDIGKYVCGGKGKAWDLTTIRHVKTKVCDKDDSYEIHVEYTFDTLKFNYPKFYVRFLGIGLEGELDLRFAENLIEIVIGVPSVKIMAQKISQNILNPSPDNCFVRIVDFNAVELKYKDHDFLAHSHVRRDAFSSKMASYFKEHKALLKQQFESQTLQEVHRTLTQDSASSAWICNDDDLKDLIKRKGGSVEPPKRSSSFKDHCT